MYEFGPFRLDTLSRRLLRDGQRVRLTAKAFELLLLLVRRKGQIVGKAEMFEAVWPGQRLEENNLTVAISALRKALGESYHNRIYIETVSGHGYRFAGRVREVAPDEAEARVRRGSSPTAGDVESIAVLPLVNEGSEPQIDYLCDGITEYVIDSLSRLPNLRVVARSISFRHRGWEDARQAGIELGVGAVLAGRILRQRGRLIISAELVNTGDGTQLWGERYDRELSDVLAVQEEIARDVTAKLRIRLTQEDSMLLGKRYTESTEAYHLYLKGRYLWNQFHREAVERGVEYFKQAIVVDPLYSLAYSGLADAYLRLAAMYLPPKELLPMAKDAALKAVEIDGTLAEARASLGLIKLWYEHDWASAGRDCRLAINLNPRAVIPHKCYGLYLMFLGHFEEAVTEYELAQELDPLSLQLYVEHGAALYTGGRYDAALEQFTKALGLEPRYYPARYAVAWVHVQREDYKEAVAELSPLCSAGEDVHLARGLLSYVHALLGERDEAGRILRELETTAQQRYVPPYAVALARLGLGDKEGALEQLEALYEERSYWLLWLNILPEFAVLRHDQRFVALLRRAGFQPAR